jgi:hypothetical protein
MLFICTWIDFKSCYSSAIYNNPYVNLISLEDIRLKLGVSSHKPALFENRLLSAPEESIRPPTIRDSPKHAWVLVDGRRPRQRVAGTNST